MKRVIIFSLLLALAGTTANAAAVHSSERLKRAHTVATLKHPSARKHMRAAHRQLDENYGSRLGYAFRAAPRHGYESSAPSEPPSFTDSSSSNRSEDAAEAIQSSNDEAALNASTAAAEQQNEAAQAAAQQTENNANSQ